MHKSSTRFLYLDVNLALFIDIGFNVSKRSFSSIVALQTLYLFILNNQILNLVCLYRSFDGCTLKTHI